MIDPSSELYPFLERWPTPSETAETLLVRREGDEVLFLSPLRFQPDAALNLRYPLTYTDLLAVKAVLGQTGPVTGLDYRGHAVIGAVSPVPGSPWYLVARMDLAEVETPLRERLWQTLAFFGVLLLAAVSALGSLWHQQRLRFYRVRFENAEALRESEARFRTLVEQEQSAIFVQRNQMFAYLNPAAVRLFGADSMEALEGEPVVEHFHPSCRDQVRERIRILNEERQTVPLNEETIVRMDGSPREVEVSAAPIVYQGEQGAVVFVHDISERKQAAAAIQAAQKLLQDITDNSTSLIYALDLEGYFILINRSLEQVLGARRETLIGKPREAILPAAYAALQRANDLQVIESGQPHLFEEENQQSDGLHFYLSLKFPLRTPKGELYGISVISTDITAYKQAQGDRDLFYSAMAASLNEVYLFDAETLKFTFVNTGALRNLQLTLEQAHQLTPLDIKPEYDREAFERLARPLRSGEKAIQVFETVHLRLDGTTYPVEVHLQYFEKGQVFLAIVQDISERKRAELALQAYSERLEEMVAVRTRELEAAQEKLVQQERLALLGQLAGGIGHELRNPLGVISNAVYFLRLYQPEAEAKVQEYLEIIESQVRTADKIITDLLYFGRQRTVELEPTPVDKLLDEALRRFPPFAQVEVHCEIEPGLPVIFIDLQQMVQVLGNLLVNAYQAMPEGGEVVVEAKCSQPGWLAIAVRDRGGGISPENQARLFEPLFTTKARGIGLGLAVSRKLAEVNGGAITFESAVGIGSTFIINLPVSEERV